jgi:hypothetical protein
VSTAPAQAYGLSPFRLAEDPRLVVVSGRIRSALEAANLRGLLFQSTQSYDGYEASAEQTLEVEQEGLV